jgi:hypothetical protein
MANVGFGGNIAEMAFETEEASSFSRSVQIRTGRGSLRQQYTTSPPLYFLKLPRLLIHGSSRAGASLD